MIVRSKLTYIQEVNNIGKRVLGDEELESLWKWWYKIEIQTEKSQTKTYSKYTAQWCQNIDTRAT